MITEEQARTLFRAEPEAGLDGRTVLAAARRARQRRRAGVAAAVTCAAVAVVAVGVRPPARRVEPAPSATPAPSPATRLDPAQVGGVVPLTRYTERGERREAVAYFVRRGTTLSVCTASLGGAVPIRHGCAEQVQPGATHVAYVSRDPGSVGLDAPTPGPSSFGRNLWYAVVGTEVASGWFVDETGARHDATVLGADDPALPARILLADLHDHVFRAVHVAGADGTVLTNDAARAVRADANPIGSPTRVASYTDRGVRRDVYAYFATMSAPGRADTVMLCTSAVGPRDVTDLGCHGPALPGTSGSPDVGAAGAMPGGVEDGPRSTFGPLGRGWSLTVVSTRVARGVVVDDRGGRHEGTILGADDPTLPARFLVAELGERWFRGVEVYDANGRLLRQ
ncbi:MAG TPA: hypothetical protein VGX28_11650 [Frankiaceae bacterium]|nr:hypothetical protein [Frankiaceae bacterium]